mgnify:CR=1 FL=1
MSDSENSTNSQLYRGVCKWFNSNKGYGFITITSSDNKDKDVFVHQKNINPVKSTYRTLSQGEYIQFNLDDNSDLDKRQAINVCGIDNGLLMCDHTSSNHSKVSD